MPLLFLAREDNLTINGDVAQPGERYVRNVQVRGSNPLISTKIALDKVGLSSAPTPCHIPYTISSTEPANEGNKRKQNESQEVK